MINGGIDQQIQQKADAYRGNPQQLQQRYAQNKQLIDLLALQKLKSEKEAAARDMAMQMQQQPSTIKQQLESEMVQRTKDDMAKQLGGIMQKKQADQQKRASQMGIATNAAPNMQQMASGGIVGFAGPQGSQVQGAQGRLTPMLRRPSTGSIYDSLDAEAIGELTEKELKELGITSRASFEALPESTKKELLQKINDRRALARAGTEVGNLPAAAYDTIAGLPAAALENTTEAIKTSRLGRVLGLSEPGEEPEYVGASPAQAGLNQTRSENMPVSEDTLLSQLESPDAQIAAGATPTMRGATAAQVQQNQRPPVPTEDETDYLQESAPVGSSEVGAEAMRRVNKALGGQEQEGQNDQQSGIGALLNKETPQVNVPAASSQFEVKPQTADYTEADKLSQGLEDAFRKDSQLDPTAAQDAEYEKALGRIGYSADEKALRQKRIDELEDIRQRRMSPEELRRQKMDAFLAAGSQQSGGIGSVFGAGFRGAKGAERQAQLAETGLLKDVMGAETDLMKEGSAQRTAAYDAGLKLGQQVRTQRGEGLKGIAGLSEGQARRAEEEAKRLSDANIATLEGRDRQRAMELKSVIATMDMQYKNDALKLEAMLGTSKNDVLKSYNEAKTVSDIQQVESQVLSEIAKSTAAFTEYFGDKIENAQLVGDEATQKESIKALQQQQRNAIEASTRELRTLLTELRQRRTGFGAAQPTGQ